MAGSAASGGPITPSTMLATSTGVSMLNGALIANSEEAKYDVSAQESRIPSTAPAIAPSGAEQHRCPQVHAAGSACVRAPIAFIVAISVVCSPTSVLIVLDSSTSAPKQGEQRDHVEDAVMLLNVLFPGQSPGARISGRSLNPVNPGTVCR